MLLPENESSRTKAENKATLYVLCLNVMLYMKK